MTAGDDRALEKLRMAAPLFERVSHETRLLDSLQWPPEVERAFFAAGARELPVVEYHIDRERARTNVEDLEAFVMSLDVADPVQHWLVRQARSYADGNRMMLAVGTERFYQLSLDVFGGPRTPFDHDSSNLDLADHLERRLAGEGLPHAGGRVAKATPLRNIDARRERPDELSSSSADLGADLGADPDRRQGDGLLDDRAFANALATRAQAIGLPLNVVIDGGICAKVVAGRERVRVRAGGQFRRDEVDGLFAHEVETHALTAQNGAAQPELSWLKSGGPRTTRTQEGLAVFSEFYHHALSIDRLRRIVARVRYVAHAEEGATFLDLYRMILEAGSTDRDAFLDAQRICRGGLLTGRAPFTKDACYLAGLTEVYNFLQVAVRGGAHEAIEVLISGRLAIDDLAVLLDLRRRGILHPPKYVPGWVHRWDALLPYFAFASFLREIDLGEVAARHRALLAATAVPHGGAHGGAYGGAYGGA